jgi:hypothetical protein
MEVGGQSVGVELNELRRFSDNWSGIFRGSLRALVLAAVNSEFAFLADVADIERLRECDYGPGAGFNIAAALRRHDRNVLSVWRSRFEFFRDRTLRQDSSILKFFVSLH